MADGHGGKRTGSGRKRGSGDKPHIRNYWTEEQITEFFQGLFERAKTSDRLAVFVGEQLSGKAMQPIGGDEDHPLHVVFDHSFDATPRQTKRNRK